MADQVDPTLPQSAFAYPSGSVTAGTPTGSEQVVTTSGPIGKSGPLYLKSAGWNATTHSSDMALSLAAPIAGSSANGGDDNLELEIINVDGRYHTITTAEDCFNGDSETLVFDDGASPPIVKRSVRLRAYGGVWYTDASGVTLS
jgi:hypothetical protein